MVNATLTTRAQQFQSLYARFGVPQCRIATWMGVTENTVSRWLKKARADDAGQVAKDGLEPDRSRVLHARALVAIARSSPGLLTHLAWTDPDFETALSSVQGEPLLLRGEKRRQPPD